jgi:hypothetical protein
MDDELFMAAGGKDGGGGGGGGSGKEGAGSGSGHKPGGLTSFVAGRGKVRPWCPEQQWGFGQRYTLAGWRTEPKAGYSHHRTAS